MNEQRIQLSRAKGFRLQDYSLALNGLPAKKCDRTSKFGNPFKVGKYLNAWEKAFVAIRLGNTPDEIRGVYKVGTFRKPTTLEQSLEWYEMHLNFMIESSKIDLNELRNHNLACWCNLLARCHCDIILKLLNQQ